MKQVRTMFFSVLIMLLFVPDEASAETKTKEHTLAASSDEAVTTQTENGITDYLDVPPLLSNNHITYLSSSVLSAHATEPEDEEMTIHFLDVGQGDSMLVESPTGETMLIDGGRQWETDTILSYLEKEEIDELDWVVGTHPDADHIGGLIGVLEEVEVKNVLDSGKEHTTDTYLDYLEVIDEQNINFVEAQEGDDVDVAPLAQVQILNGYNESSDLNESSIVLRVSYKDIDVMFMGDATEENEEEILEQYDVEAEILKAGHHGADTSTSSSFVDAVDPEAAVLSYGDNNYGHPDPDVMERLRVHDTDLFSTDDSGHITVTTEGNHYDIHAQPWDGTEEDTDPAQELVNINTAGFEELQEITGVGPTLAQNILDYREANGPFESMEELDNVPYIGPATIEEMRPDITLG
ncbi:helix-hairpin-helix domain-containing protein [Marinococcus halotolerans]|uniref:helix-hairpin-helix domain-containing protein n=1 Tax=Marinococcus halotolerans TaxID=301092 RepID=UPI0003B36C9F|nr:helix-hairpin-helix domain-containing protein [Marinococcus halotolerans]